MGTVSSGRRGYHGGKPLTRELPQVSLLRGMVDIRRPEHPLLLIECERAMVIQGVFHLVTSVVTTPCHLGGVRRWLVCPACDARRQSLYIAEARLLCRVCAGLRYPTQTMNRRYRAIARADRIRRRLGWEVGALRPWGVRPGRMRWKTFERLTEALRDVEAYLLPDLNGWAERAEQRVDPKARPNSSTSSI